MNEYAKMYDPINYWDSVRSHETDASPSVGAHTVLVFLAGAIKWWWEPGKWDSPEHREYIAWRNEVRKWLIDTGYLTYAPHEAFKGTWVEGAQAVNDAAIRASKLMIVMSDSSWITEGTDDEVLLAKRLGVPVFYAPSYAWANPSVSGMDRRALFLVSVQSMIDNRITTR